VLADVLPGVPIAITWLLFVYPSRVYMTEFYLNTWSGQCLAKILLLLFKSYNDREESNHLYTTDLPMQTSKRLKWCFNTLRQKNGEKKRCIASLHHVSEDATR
jgi:hypothetical protein